MMDKATETEQEPTPCWVVLAHAIVLVTMVGWAVCALSTIP